MGINVVRSSYEGYMGNLIQHKNIQEIKNTDPKLMKAQMSAVKKALQVLSSCGAMVEVVETRVPCNSFQLVFTKCTD
jgi:hypothetical protein